ncbi:Thrombomodulin [Bagarius yarrelli]|uniref:Thrombomodulin n=1 Tax=Bagarius yarrelli TaxID=175774 RepID=A0A556TZM1_BAGYA|nr:Thrombomodulin [Bagarius yarrelli]
MKPFLGVVMALALLRVQGRKSIRGDCVDEFCVTVHTHALDFHSAQQSCADKGAHLMTVRSLKTSRVVSDVLTGSPGDFWIGLRYNKNICSESTQKLKGFTWITGDRATNFTNWKNTDVICSPRCVSVSKDDPEWIERSCDRPADGYLCEHMNVQDKCNRLASDFPVLYETPFGFSSEDLQEIPAASNATQQHLGTKFVCFEGHWIKAPWNCEVYKGGCEHECEKRDDAFICTCSPGYELEDNAVHCSRALSDPCVRAKCSQECVMKAGRPVCQCRSGYELEKDGKTCKNINNCNDKRLCPDENSYCVDTSGGFECVCRKGFRMEQGRCEDDDECFSGPCEHSCNNTIGSYQCECSDGYRVSSENSHECMLYCPESECPVVACDHNNPFQCECPNGFILEERLDGRFCVDIDECEASPCDHTCKNTPGKYECACMEGYELSHTTRCVKRKGLSTTTSASTGTPPSCSPPIGTASSLSAEGILGIIVCAVVVVLLTVCVVRHHKKRCGKINTYKDTHALQQVTTEKYVKKLSITS